VKPLVSILIPAFNAETWIANALRSALAQPWDRKDIIVVDDSSRKRTLAIAKQFGFLSSHREINLRLQQGTKPFAVVGAITSSG
jgi:glycosyltransferase involved in cell wall biosynthesis